MKRWLIDNQRFANNREELQGEIALDDCERLDDLLGNDEGRADGNVTFQLQGTRGPLGQLRLNLRVQAEVAMVCQRCMGAMLESVDVLSKLDVAPDDATVAHDDLTDDEADWIETSREFDVAELVEDELILALPVAPRHQVCPDPVTESTLPAKKESPFAALAALKNAPVAAKSRAKKK